MHRFIAKFTEDGYPLNSDYSIAEKLAILVHKKSIKFFSPNPNIKQFANLCQDLPLRILLADDSPVDINIALCILRYLGYEPDVVFNGVELLKTLRKQHYDLVMTDVKMPEMGGVEATRKICQEWKPQERPYIIALTSENEPEDWERCLHAGMNTHIPKPLEIHKFIEALMSCSVKSL